MYRVTLLSVFYDHKMAVFLSFAWLKMEFGRIVESPSKWCGSWSACELKQNNNKKNRLFRNFNFWVGDLLPRFELYLNVYDLVSFLCGGGLGRKGIRWSWKQMELENKEPWLALFLVLWVNIGKFLKKLAWCEKITFWYCSVGW